MLPGLQLRQVRERLGLTYRDVERCSYEIAAKRGRPEFILHISRLADIENRNVVPSLHKLYALAVVYHLNPMEIFRWYDNPAFNPKRTAYLSRMVEQWGNLEGTLFNGERQHRYGYIGLGDRRMMPILRPGSIVLVDTLVRRIADIDWSSEYDRPMYFVEVREGYRCGWFHQEGPKLVMQPHPLSRCMPEWWSTPDEAEIVGRVVGVVTRLNEPWNSLAGVQPAARAD